MTTAPSTLMMMGTEPGGKLGTTHPEAAWPQSMWTMDSSNTKEMPMSETNPMMYFSIRR